MKMIGVISDTHMPRMAKSLPEEVVSGFKDADLIIHAGDINRDHVIYELQEIAPVEAVAGNTDDDYIRSVLGRKKTIDIDGCRIGIIHGDGASGSTLDRVVKAFAGERVDCVVFGHSHIPFNRVINGVLYFNPGSPTDKRTQERYSYGMLKVEGKTVSGEIFFL